MCVEGREEQMLVCCSSRTGALSNWPLDGKLPLSSLHSQPAANAISNLRNRGEMAWFKDKLFN